MSPKRVASAGLDPIITGKIALAHLSEFPDYYTRLARMEEDAKGAHEPLEPAAGRLCRC